MKDITFVLLSCGEHTENECRLAVQPFIDEIEFIEIKNIFPQIKALNQMVDSVKTEYFIPLDADMVLYKDSWQRISTAWRQHWRDPKWHTILFSLWDVLTQRKILALKLMRTEMIREVPFMDSATPDVEHFARLTSKGYTCVQNYIRLRPVGDHIVKGRHFCYHKYRDVYQTYRSHNCEWDSAVFFGGDTIREKAKAHYDFFLYQYLTSDNEDYLACIAGMMDGILSPVENRSKTLEYKTYKFSNKDAVSVFLDWYMSPFGENELLLF